MFVITPLFAFVNAGVRAEESISALVTNAVPLGAFFGLVFGKQIGITPFAWGAVKSGIASLPNAVGWRHIYGVARIGGIGFTVSLF